MAGRLRRNSLDRFFEWDARVVLTDLIVQDGNTSAVGELVKILGSATMLIWCSFYGSLTKSLEF